MLKKQVMLVSILLIVVVMVSGCGKTAPVEQTVNESQGVKDEPVKDEPKVLRIWTHENMAFNAGYEALAEKYMVEHPDVLIKFETFNYDVYIQTLQTSMPAGTEADIMQMFGSWVCSYADGGNFSVVPDDISTESLSDLILSAPLGGYNCDGKYYGVPQEFNIEYGAIMVNTNIANEVGATGYVDGWSSWDELIEDAQKMTTVQDDVMLRAGYNFTSGDGLATMFHSMILQYGGSYLVDGTYVVKTEEALKTLELMKSLVDAGVVDPVLFNDGENWVGDSFFEETSVMGLVGPWAIPEYAGDYEDVAAATIYSPLPSDGDPTFAAASGWGLSVSAHSEVQDIAWDFVKYVTLNNENAIEWNLATGTLPALNANLVGDNAETLVSQFSYFEPFFDILEFGVYEGQFPDRDFVWYEVVYPEIINYLQGNATADETLDTIQSAVQNTY